MTRTVLLDNEAVRALREAGHPKHRTALAHVVATVGRRKKAVPVRLAVPTAVRVEAGWDRTAPRSALINRLRIEDLALDAGTADLAARTTARAGVSVADAHIGAAAQLLGSAGAVTVLSSDPDDMRAAASPTAITVVVL